MPERILAPKKQHACHHRLRVNEVLARSGKADIHPTQQKKWRGELGRVGVLVMSDQLKKLSQVVRVCTEVSHRDSPITQGHARASAASSSRWLT
jgi:hypothetical protein